MDPAIPPLPKQPLGRLASGDSALTQGQHNRGKLLYFSKLILKMEIITPNNRVSVSIAVLRTLNMASDSHMVLIVVSLSSYSSNVQEKAHFSFKCFFLFLLSSLKVTTLSFPVSFLLSCLLLMGSCVVYSTEGEASNLGYAAS